MAWLRRNWMFVVVGVIALGVFGVAIGFLIKGYLSNQRALNELTSAYNELKRLYNLDPHPGTEGKHDNIVLAKQQQEEVRKFISKASEFFKPVRPIPDSANITTEEFTARLRVTLDQLQRAAARASVTLPRTNYAFTFESIRPRVRFETNSLPLLAAQLGEIKAICEAFFDAKVLAIDNIRRGRVCAEDSPEMYPSDYITETPITNGIAILTPYEITFRCFSSELSGVLNRLANAPWTFVIKYLDVEPVVAGLQPEEYEGYGAPITPETEFEGPRIRPFMRPLTPREVYGGGPEPRLGTPEGALSGIPPRPAPIPGRGGTQVMLSETPFRVSMLIYVVKLNLPELGTTP